MELPMIEFHLDANSGLSPYQQVVQQVRQALRLGLLNEGDQLPKVKDVVAGLAINPNTVLKAYRELGKKYRRRWALTGCTLEIEAGHVTGLVGPNGAGKSTLLNIASGMLEPTTGTIEVCGGVPGTGPEQLAKVGYVAQNTPVYPG